MYSQQNQIREAFALFQEGLFYEAACLVESMEHFPEKYDLMKVLLGAGVAHERLQGSTNSLMAVKNRAAKTLCLISARLYFFVLL